MFFQKSPLPIKLWDKRPYKFGNPATISPTLSHGENKSAARLPNSFRPLRRKLLATFLPTVLVPLGIAGVVSGSLVYRRAAQQAAIQLHDRAVLTAELIWKDLDSKMVLLSAVTANPLVLDAARAGSQQAEAQGLQHLPIEEVEAQFASKKLLKPDTVLNRYLQSTAFNGHFAEVFFTDRHGFNVAYSHVTSDFVQRDEDWWQRGQLDGQWIDKPSFDQSTNRVTVDLVQAIRDPNSGKFLGVIKGGYEVSYFSLLAEQLQKLKLSGAQKLQIISLGKLDSEVTAIATVDASGTDLNHPILGGRVLCDRARELLAKNESRSLTLSALETASLAHENRYYTLAQIPGTAWVVVASMDRATIQAAGNQMVAIFAAIFLGLGILVAIVVLRLSRQLSAPLTELAGVAQRVTEQEDFSLQASTNSHDEVGVLADSLNQLIRWVANHTRELKSAQANLIQAEKMSALGQTVAGVAHEINNPVNFIYGNLPHAREYIQDLMQLIEAYQSQYPNPPDTIQQQIEAIDLEFVEQDLLKLMASMRIGADRIRAIVLSLRNFSRIDEGDAKFVDLHEGIESTLLILQNRLKAKPDRPAIAVVKNYGALPEVECYPGQLNQVVMNILSNAIDALEEQNRGRTFEEICDNPNVIRIMTKQSKPGWVALHIVDNGIGIPEAVVQKIFDPFFTTKDVGNGTGLGLAISYQIVTETHHGKLRCLSTPGQGTEFVMELPVQQSH